jgi:cell division protein FtsL
MSIVRVSMVIWLIVAGAVALGLYQVKYEVQRLEEELSEVRRDIRQDRVALHVLEAEWAYLNRPERLKQLASEHLDMQPTAATQVAAVTALPPRIAEQAPRFASVELDGAEKAMPLPRAKPWSLEQPMYARAAPHRQTQPETRPGQDARGTDTAIRQVAARATGTRTEAAPAASGTADRAEPAEPAGEGSANSDPAGKVGRSDEPGRAEESPTRETGGPASRQVVVGDILIRVGARQP